MWQEKCHSGYGTNKFCFISLPVTLEFNTGLYLSNTHSWPCRKMLYIYIHYVHIIQQVHDASRCKQKMAVPRLVHFIFWYYHNSEVLGLQPLCITINLPNANSFATVTLIQGMANGISLISGNFSTRSSAQSTLKYLIVPTLIRYSYTIAYDICEDKFLQPIDHFHNGFFMVLLQTLVNKCMRLQLQMERQYRRMCTYRSTATPTYDLAVDVHHNMCLTTLAIVEEYVKQVTAALWYLDPHYERLSSRSVHLRQEFRSFCSFNNWQPKKVKQPLLQISMITSKL